VLGASSEEVGVAPSSGERRRPWRRCCYWEEDGEEKSEKRKRRGEMRRASWRPGDAPGSLLGLKAASRRWHAGDPAQDTQLLCLLEEEGIFAENPLGFGRFQGEKDKNCTLCNILYFKWCAEILKFGRDFLEK
jgi:hypothetical protein